MRDLGEPLNEKLRELVQGDNFQDENLRHLINTVVDGSTDYEHIITFLEDAPSQEHRRFALEMKRAFEVVLREQLHRIREDMQDDPTELYEVLVDLYNIDRNPEQLQGIITLNYDEYLEAAIEKVSTGGVDFGIRVEPTSTQKSTVKLLKLHGSFGWQDTWPIRKGENGESTLWIPPGIHKAKQTYPFNVIWGLARELLDCDILRVVGCRLAGNDWDLVSLLFAMQHVNSGVRPRIEVIDAPCRVEELREMYPYLDLMSILDVERIGGHLIGEARGTNPQDLAELTEEDRADVVALVSEQGKWFERWLQQKVELLNAELGSVQTVSGAVDRFLSA